MNIEKLLQHGLEAEIFTAAEALVVQGQRVKLHRRAGAAGTFSKFDLSSLTKPWVVANLLLRLQAEKRLDLEQTVSDFFRSKTLKDVTLRALLEHRSGLIAWHPFLPGELALPKPHFARNKKQIVKMILQEKKFLKSGSAETVYSDLNFILLGAILEKACGKRLDKWLYKKTTFPLQLTRHMHFLPLPVGKRPIHNYVPSEVCRRRGRLMQAEVQDENAYVMGGVAGHAGLFGNATAVYDVLFALSRHAVIAAELRSRLATPLAKRPRFVLGFDTVAAKKSHFGKSFDRASTLCHLGFSGTSFAWDLKRDLFVILLTNRCFFGRDNQKIQDFRVAFHDLVNQNV